jgi:transposase
MRQGRNGLSGIVTDHMKFNALDPKTIYIFFNKRRNQVKLLLWEKDGHSVYHKRLSSGTYALPEFNSNGAVEITRQQLSLILDGIEIKLTTINKRVRFNLTMRLLVTGIYICDQ